jgi:N-acetyl-anhydromuramoyl-L-alanine amidase
VRVTDDHWLSGVRRLESPNCNERDDPRAIELVVVHGISLPPGRFGGRYIHDLFLNRLDAGADPALADLAGMRVSAHLLIDRRGAVTQFVPFHRRAWHAGESVWRRRPGCNDYAIGIELEGTDDRPYTASQYRRLRQVLEALMARYPRLSPEAVVGHFEVAPGRKTDPGPAFSWRRLLARES